MSILKVARMGHPILRTRARPIDPAEITSPRVQQLIDDMFETMREYQGIGLAARFAPASVCSSRAFLPIAASPTRRRRTRGCR